LRVSLVTSCADEGTPAQGEAVAPPFESFSRKVLAQARDALEKPGLACGCVTAGFIG
jgi:hypothetical protein